MLPSYSSLVLSSHGVSFLVGPLDGFVSVPSRTLVVPSQCLAPCTLSLPTVRVLGFYTNKGPSSAERDEWVFRRVCGP